MNPLCFVNTAHPLAALVKGRADVRAIFVEDGGLDIPAGDGRMVVDLCLLKSPEKKRWIKRLSEAGFYIVGDLSVNWAEGFHRLYPRLRASSPLAFYSPKKTYELYAGDDEAASFLVSFLKLLGLGAIEVEEPGVGFHFPRTLAMVINEAYFSLEEGLASREDIDGAMKYGVNYPLGPFEWAEKIGVSVVVDLLDELYGVLGDSRYRASRLLRLESMGGA